MAWSISSLSQCTFNEDKGSSQAIFKELLVVNQDTVKATSNNDGVTIVAGQNITLTSSASDRKLTIGYNEPAFNSSGALSIPLNGLNVGGTQLVTANGKVIPIKI